MKLEKLFDRSVQSYEMDFYRYLPPANLMRLTANAFSAALRDYGYDYENLNTELGATWMLGMVDMHVLRDLRVKGKDANLMLYASPLHRARSNFMLRILAVEDDKTLISATDVCVMAVRIKERKVIRTDEVVAKLGAPANEILLPPPERLELPEDMEHVMDQPIRYFDCDLNQHLNSYRYADYISQAAGYWDHGKHVKAERMRIQFDSECLPGELLSLYKKDTEEGTYVKGVKRDGTTSFKALMRLEKGEEEA